MKVTEVRVELVRKVGEYEKDTISMTATPEDGEDPRECATELKKAILVIIHDKETKTEDKGKVVITKEKPQKQQEPQGGQDVSETSKESVKEVSKESNEKSEETSKEEVVAEEKPKKERKPETEKKPRTVSRTKKTAYDRNLDTHKNLLGTFLDAELGNWRSGDLLKKAGAASRKLDEMKADFLDENGEILESFKGAFLALVRE
jgi:hypothetical protein